MLNHHEKLFILLTLAILFMAPVLFSQIDAGVTAVSQDTIAIRVIANPNHYSALRWYKQQKFTGSPQSIIVDGYEGIRDGRTVYVNAANANGSNLYTNIYLISYNQQAENATVDIFGEMLQHWKFNDNVSAVGTCSLASSTACAITSDCEKGDYCTSVKAKVIRDVRRMADMQDLATAIENYKIRNGFYPKLAAGSYLTNKSVSTWPSWRERLGSDLGIPIPVDPVNKLGDCGGTNFNPVTCWDENTKRFAGATGAASITLPVGSMAYAYAAAANGTSYLLFIGTESGVLTASGAFNYTGGTVGGTGGMGGGGAVTVLPPSVFCGTMNGTTGTVFNGFINASDPSGGSLTWAINTSGSTWTGWSAAPTLQTTALPNQRSAWASRAGAAGNYSVSVTVNSSNGGSATVNCPVVINGICGDGTINGGEQCDSTGGACTSIAGGGYASGNYACNANCTYDTSSCIPVSSCGNGSIEPGEQCDGAGGACTAISAGYSGGNFTCNPNCTYNTSACISAPVCGNAIQEGSEQCDINGGACTSITGGGYASGNYTCNANCTYNTSACVAAPVCGNSVREGTEQCDGTGGACTSIAGGGYISGNYTCSAICTYNASACVAAPVCGNGVREGTEQCDGAGGACTSIAGGGYTSGNYSCNANCTYNTSACTTGCIFDTSNLDSCILP